MSVNLSISRSCFCNLFLCSSNFLYCQLLHQPSIFQSSSRPLSLLAGSPCTLCSFSIFCCSCSTCARESLVSASWSRGFFPFSTQLNSTQLNSTQLNSTQLNSTQLNSTQLNSTQLNSTQLTQLNSTQLNSTQLNSTQLNSTQLNNVNASTRALTWSTTLDGRRPVNN